MAKTVSKWKRTVVVAVAAAIILLAALIVIIANITNNNSSDVSTPPQDGVTITVEGEYECLPKPEGPQTLECAFGLDADGTHYALDFSQMEGSAPHWQQFSIGDQLRVTGTYEARESIYLSPGKITVEAAEKLQ